MPQQNDTVLAARGGPTAYLAGGHNVLAHQSTFISLHSGTNEPSKRQTPKTPSNKHHKGAVMIIQFNYNTSSAVVFVFCLVGINLV